MLQQHHVSGQFDHYNNEIKQARCIWWYNDEIKKVRLHYFGAIFSLRNNIHPDIPKSDGNGAPAN